MVLAAGLGTRLAPFTQWIPKPLIPLHGRTALRLAFESLKTLSPGPTQNTVVNIHAHSSLMRVYLEQPCWESLQIQVSDESQKLLGSAGGFRKALPLFKQQAFFALNADIVHQVNLEELALRHQQLRRQYGVVMTLAVHRGLSTLDSKESYREIILDSDQKRVLALGIKKSNSTFYTGVAIFEPEAFNELPLEQPREFATDVLEPWIQKNKVGVYLYSDLWIDLGSPEHWWSAHQKVNSNIFRHLETDWDRVPSSSPLWIHYQRHPSHPWVSALGPIKKFQQPSLQESQGIQLEHLCYPIPAVEPLR